MKNDEKIDYFGFKDQSELYDAFRPKYPEDLIMDIVNGSECKDLAVDVGTGTGLLAFPLADHFSKVIGLDISLKQLEIAIKKNNRQGLTFAIGDSSNLENSVPEHSASVITVGQAYHWFDSTKFFESCRKILKPHGKIMLCGYNMFEIVSSELHQKLLSSFYSIIKPYFDCDRLSLELEYSDQKFDFQHNELKYYIIEKEARVSDLLRYLETFSAYRMYLKKFEADPNFENPLTKISEEYASLNLDTLTVKYRYFLRTLYDD